jgi:hypothetical protein
MTSDAPTCSAWGTLLLFAHGTYEAEALAKHGTDEALLLAIVADRASGRIDAGAQR